jgi:digeranylgeranylglycerophospholipid reductase
MTPAIHDVIVIGAGPVGLTVAQVTAAAGLKVLVLDKKSTIGVPVRCGEYVTRQGIEKVLKVKPRWISAGFNRARLFAPNGVCVEISGDPHIEGYILDRTVCEQDLAAAAAQHGATLKLRTYAAGLVFRQDTVCGVRTKTPDGYIDYPARLVVGADGVEGRTGRWAGLTQAIPAAELGVCAQYVLDGVELAPDSFEIHLGHHIAPGGYLWVFPKGNGRANVGVGISGGDAASPLYYLDHFVRERHPHCRTVSRIVGGVPGSLCAQSLVRPGFLLVGDAARQVNPLTGGGLTSGILAAQAAGATAVQALRAGDVSIQQLSRYETEFTAAYGHQQQRHYQLKQIIDRLTDAEINAAADVLAQQEGQPLSLAKLFRTALWKHPAMLLHVARIFAAT